MAGQDFEGTRVDEISDGIFRISTPVASIAMLFHTGKRRMFSQVQANRQFRMQWLDTPHLPHGWEAGLIM
jgi:hypothetical protein